MRKAFVMNLHPGKESEYRERHDAIWSNLRAVLKEHGVSNYSIFLLPGTSQLFAYVEIEDEERWERVAKTQVCREWWSYMEDIMACNPDSSPIAVPLREVFHLD